MLVRSIFWGALIATAASGGSALICRATRRIEPRLPDLTGLRFVSAFLQAFSQLVGFILFAHLVPQFRASGTALLAGVSVVSIVFRLAAQNTLGNLVVDLCRVLYRPSRVRFPGLHRPSGRVGQRRDRP